MIIVIIVLSSILLALEDPSVPTPLWMNAVDHTFLSIFTVEMGLKHIAYGVVMTENAYWRDSWNLVDGFIVIFGWIGVIGSASGLEFLMAMLWASGLEVL